MANTNTLVFTEAGWEADVLQSQEPVLVDFWGTGCPPCGTIAPSVDALAEEYAGKVKVGKLDVGANGATAARYRIRGVPTLLMFRGGEVVGQIVGGVGKSTIQEFIERHIA